MYHMYIIYSRLLTLIKGRGTQIVAKMDVSILSQFFYGSYTYKLCSCILQCTHTVIQWLVIVANTHLEEGQVSATHSSLLFPFVHAPTEIALFTIGHGNGWRPTSNVCVCRYACVLCTHNVKVNVKCSRYRPSCGPEGGQRYSSTLPWPRH